MSKIGSRRKRTALDSSLLSVSAMLRGRVSSGVQYSPKLSVCAKDGFRKEDHVTGVELGMFSHHAVHTLGGGQDQISLVDRFCGQGPQLPPNLERDTVGARRGIG